jgi:hypothetical protein
VSREKQHLTRARASLAIAKRVLFIEGPDDKAVYSAWLAKIDPLWADRLELIPTGGKNDLDTALPALGNPAEAFALRPRRTRRRPHRHVAGCRPEPAREPGPALPGELLL